MVTPRNTLYILTPVWDHYIPFTYTRQLNSASFVAACCRCNLHKSSFIITNEEEENSLIEYLKARWFNKGWLDLGGAIQRNLAMQSCFEDEDDENEGEYEDFDK